MRPLPARVISVVVPWLLYIGVHAASADNDLKRLQCVGITVEKIDKEFGALGVTEEAIHNAVLVELKAKLPRLSVQPTKSCLTGDRVYVSLNLDSHPLGMYYGNVEVRILRRVVISGTGEGTIAPVWLRANIVTGGNSTISDIVRRGLTSMLEAFAADYYRAGNR